MLGAVNVGQIGEIKRANEIGYKGTGTFIWLACPQCKKERWIQIVRGQPRYVRCRHCANTTEDVKRKRQINTLARLANQDPHERRGINCPNWKGGKTKSAEGYILRNIQPDDFFFPMVNPITRYALEHRLNMAKHLGRNLHTWEVVHHKNSIKDDNRIENLQLVSEDRHNVMTQLERQINHLKEVNKELSNENKKLKEKLGDGICYRK